MGVRGIGGLGAECVIEGPNTDLAGQKTKMNTKKEEGGLRYTEKSFLGQEALGAFGWRERLALESVIVTLCLLRFGLCGSRLWLNYFR